MKALCWHGKHDIRCETVPDPEIEHPRDAIVKMSCCAICGSDLHLYDGFIPGMKSGDILGHEFMGEVVEVGAENKQAEGRRPGRRAVHDLLRRLRSVPTRQLVGLRAHQPQQGHRPTRCSATPPPACSATPTSPAGYAGGQAEYVRVPFADVAPVKIPDGLTDEQVLFLGDIFPTGWQAAAQCDIAADRHGRDLGRRSGRPVRDQERSDARRRAGGRASTTSRNASRWRAAGGAITINFDEESVLERLQELTAGKGPDKCIDAVGMEAHATRSIDAMIDRAKQAVMLETDRPHVLREMMYVCRPPACSRCPASTAGWSTRSRSARR